MGYADDDLYKRRDIRGPGVGVTHRFQKKAPPERCEGGASQDQQRLRSQGIPRPSEP
jgi:hypothetical protein